MMINTTKGPLDESLLLKREDVIDNDNERTNAVEYCLAGCSGPAHSTGQPDSASCFCSQHVHRSVHVALKRVDALQSALGSFQ